MDSAEDFKVAMELHVERMEEMLELARLYDKRITQLNGKPDEGLALEMQMASFGALTEIHRILTALLVNDMARDAMAARARQAKLFSNAPKGEAN